MPDDVDEITWPQLLSHWPVLEAAFHDTFGIDLDTVHTTRSWRWFQARTDYLLSIDGPLARLFAPEST